MAAVAGTSHEDAGRSDQYACCPNESDEAATDMAAADLEAAKPEGADVKCDTDMSAGTGTSHEDADNSDHDSGCPDEPEEAGGTGDADLSGATVHKAAADKPAADLAEADTATNGKAADELAAVDQDAAKPEAADVKCDTDMSLGAGTSHNMNACKSDNFSECPDEQDGDSSDTVLRHFCTDVGLNFEELWLHMKVAKPDASVSELTGLVRSSPFYQSWAAGAATLCSP